MFRLSFKATKNYIKNFLILKSGKPIENLEPLVFSYYITMNCNFNCSYCSFAKSGIIRKPDNRLNTNDVFKLLKIIRQETAYIYFTGGEPLIRNDFCDILKECKRLNFKAISVNTNMSLIHDKMEILNYTTNLVASLDMLDKKAYSKVLGVPVEIVEKVKQNIITCSKLQKGKNFTMTINSVVTKETIEDTRQVMDFCLQNNIRFAVVPAEFDNGEINTDLQNNKEYLKLIKDIIKKKKVNKLIFGSKKYFETILDFKKFDCYPNLIPHVYPNGDLLYPCEPLQSNTVNLLKAGSYKKAFTECVRKYGKLPNCKNKCHKACYIEPTNIIKNPLLIREII